MGKSRVWLACGFTLVLCVPAVARAQSGCYLSEAQVAADLVRNSGRVWATISGSPGMFVQQAAATELHPADYCWSYVQSEAWVNPGGTPVIATNGPGTGNWATAVRWGNLWGVHSGNTRHWYVNAPYPSGSLQWILIDELGRSVNLGSPPPPTDQEECMLTGGQWNFEQNRCDYVNSPVILDTEGRGYSLTAAEQGVLFDIDADGQQDLIAWTRANDKSAAFLVLDRNGNGFVDDGRELFGTATLLASGEPAANGFAALAELDSNGDGRIDRSDSLYTALGLWYDLNHNGRSERSELRTLPSAGGTVLYLDYQLRNDRDSHGNVFWLQGTALIRERGVERPRAATDVLLARATEGGR